MPDQSTIDSVKNTKNLFNRQLYGSHARRITYGIPHTHARTHTHTCDAHTIYDQLFNAPRREENVPANRRQQLVNSLETTGIVSNA